MDFKIYNVASLQENAQDYLNLQIPDTAQASEKTYMAAKKVLKDYVDNLQNKYNVEIIPSKLTEEPWNNAAYSGLLALIKKQTDNNTFKKMICGWDAAFLYV